MGGVMQDCVVYRRDDEFAVRGSIDGAELATSRSAAGAIQFAVDWLGTDGGEVRLARGAYPLERAVRLSDATCLRGSGRGTKLRVRADNADGVGVLLDHAKGASVADLAEDIRGEGQRHAPDDRGGTETRQQVDRNLVKGSRGERSW